MSLNLESLKIKLEAHTEESNRRHDEIAYQVNLLKTAMDSKVSYKHLYWIIGILVTLLIPFLTYIASEISALRADESTVKSQVSYMNGVFKANDFKGS